MSNECLHLGRVGRWVGLYQSALVAVGQRLFKLLFEGLNLASGFFFFRNSTKSEEDTLELRGQLQITADYDKILDVSQKITTCEALPKRAKGTQRNGFFGILSLPMETVLSPLGECTLMHRRMRSDAPSLTDSYLT